KASQTVASRIHVRRCMRRTRHPQPNFVPRVTGLHKVTLEAMYIRVNERDNVGILVDPEGVAAGAALPGGVIARERIPQSHKVALRAVEKGEPVLRYGQTIGLANRALAPGDWVREEVLDMPAAPPLDELPLATAVPPSMPELEGYTFEGYP